VSQIAMQNPSHRMKRLLASGLLPERAAPKSCTAMGPRPPGPGDPGTR
jgi:hypothetical protein